MERLKAKPLGTAAVVLGMLAIALAVLADEIGVGGQPGFNWKQGLLLAAGIGLDLVGIVLLTGLGRRVVEEAVEPVPGENGDDPPRPR